MLAKLLAFLAAAPGSIRGIISAEEKFRALVLAIVSAPAAQVLALVLTDLGVTLPSDLMPLAVPVVAGVLDYLRRRYLHGDTGPALSPAR